jgi:hypothetical protein
VYLDRQCGGWVSFFMAKELPFFKFEISEWMFGRIQKHSEDLQGMFINICCKYWHKLGEYSYEDVCLDFQEERVKKLIEAKIINVDGDYIFIKFLDIQLDERSDHSKKQSIKGLKSAEVRKKRQQQSTTVEPRLKTVQPNSTEEKRREEKRKEDIISQSFFNEEEVFDLESNPSGLHIFVKEGICHLQIHQQSFDKYLNGCFGSAYEQQKMSLKREPPISDFFKQRNGDIFNDNKHLWSSFKKLWINGSSGDGPILYGVSNLKPWN